jgi:multiple sugar transport system substrate-binding protein
LTIKAIAGACALALTLTAVAACSGGSGDNSADGGTTTPATGEATTPDSGDSGELGEGRGPITYAQGKDTTGKLQGIIDTFNAAHPGEEVELIELPESADEQRTAMVQDLQAGAGTYDVLGMDVVWTGEFAARDWLLPLDDIDTSGLFASTVASGTYDDTLFAAPYQTNAAFLFYRTDLVDTPPTTWDELIADCSAATEAGIDCYTGQFAQYEGLTVNFSEAVNSAGGSLLDAEGNATVDTPEAADGLAFLVNGFKEGYIPEKALTYMEEESRRAFQQGEFLFLRNWPYVYNLANEEGEDSVIQGKFAVAPIPGEDGPGASTLGGYNLGIAKTTQYPETAKDFIRYLESEDVQRSVITDMSAPAVLESLYDDAAIREQLPYVDTLKAAIENAVARPKAVSYAEFSQLISENIYKALQDQADPVTTLASLNSILQQQINETK